MKFEKEEQWPDSAFFTRVYDVYQIDPIWLLTGETAKVFAHTEDIIFLRSDHPAYASCTFAVDSKSKRLREDIRFSAMSLNHSI